MPAMAGATSGATPTDRMISVRPSGQIFAADGLLSLPQLKAWLKAEAAKLKNPSLLVRASAGVPLSQLADITSAAREAGFVRIVVGAEEPASVSGAGKTR